MNELTTTTLAQLKNKDLKKDLSKMLKALDDARKNTWAYAIAISNIVESESYRDDFQSYSDFAQYIGLSKASISQYVNAVKGKEALMNSNAFAMAKWNLDNCTIGKAYIASCLDDMLDDFIAWVCTQTTIEDGMRLSDKAFKSYYNQFKDDMEKEVERGQNTEKAERVRDESEETETANQEAGLDEKESKTDIEYARIERAYISKPKEDKAVLTVFFRFPKDGKMVDIIRQFDLDEAIRLLMPKQGKDFNVELGKEVDQSEDTDNRA